MRLSALVPFAALGLAVIACSSKPDPNDPSQYNNGYPPGSYPPGSYPPGAYPTATGGGYPPGTYPTNTATPTATAPAPAAGGQATPISVAMAGPLLGVGLQAAAANDTRGMQPEGGAFAGQFQQGQTLEQPLTLEPGKCYTVVGLGGPGITELDVQIVVQPAPMLPAAPIAQDNQTGQNATLGGGGSCFKNPSPIAVPGKVVLRATGGAGMAGAQIYKK